MTFVLATSKVAKVTEEENDKWGTFVNDPPQMASFPKPKDDESKHATCAWTLITCHFRHSQAQIHWGSNLS
jgi:hypothetical protein